MGHLEHKDSGPDRRQYSPPRHPMPLVPLRRSVPLGRTVSPPRHGSLKPSENRRPSNRERSASPRPRRSHHHDKRRLCSPSPRPLPSKPSAYPGPSNRKHSFSPQRRRSCLYDRRKVAFPPPLDLVRDRQVALRSSAPRGHDLLHNSWCRVEPSLLPSLHHHHHPFLHHPHHLISPSRLIPDTLSSLPELSQKDTQKGELVNTDLFDDDAVSIDDDSDPFYTSELFPTEVSQPLQPKVVDEMAVDESMNVPNADVEMRKNAPVGPPEIAAVAAHDDADVEMRENAPVGP